MKTLARIFHGAALIFIVPIIEKTGITCPSFAYSSNTM